MASQVTNITAQPTTQTGQLVYQTDIESSPVSCTALLVAVVVLTIVVVILASILILFAWFFRRKTKNTLVLDRRTSEPLFLKHDGSNTRNVSIYSKTPFSDDDPADEDGDVTKHHIDSTTEPITKIYDEVTKQDPDIQCQSDKPYENISTNPKIHRHYTLPISDLNNGKKHMQENNSNKKGMEKKSHSVNEQLLKGDDEEESQDYCYISSPGELPNVPPVKKYTDSVPRNQSNPQLEDDLYIVMSGNDTKEHSEDNVYVVSSADLDSQPVEENTYEDMSTHYANV